MAPSTPPPPRSAVLAALTIASTCSLVISPCFIVICPIVFRKKPITKHKRQNKFQKPNSIIKRLKIDYWILDIFLSFEFDFFKFKHEVTFLKNSSISDWTDSTTSPLSSGTLFPLTTIIFPRHNVGIIAAGYTAQEVPMTKNKSDCSANAKARFKSLTSSPKKTTSGLMTPPHPHL